MKVMVPWSSGLDSTSLVVSNLEKGNIVVAPYFQIDNNETKVVMEKKIRDMFREHSYFKSFINRGKLIVTDCSPKVYLCNGNPMDLALTQPAVWLFSLLYTVDDSIDEVQLAYVLNDCAVSWINEIQAIWKAYEGLTQSGKLPTLSFPYIKMPKQEVIRVLNNVDYGIAELTWSCEMPIGEKVCGTCVPCKRRDRDNIPTASHYKEATETVVTESDGCIDKVNIVGTVTLGDTPEKETCDGHCKECDGCNCEEISDNHKSTKYIDCIEDDEYEIPFLSTEDNVLMGRLINDN